MGFRNVVVISDTHIGCRLALMHPDGARLDDGGIVKPSSVQLKLFDIWKDFWKWVKVHTKGEPFAVVHNGDAIDGTHHNSTTQWSHNLEDQNEHAFKLLEPVVSMCKENYFHIRGTEAHVGKSAVEEERLAKRLGAVKNEFGQHARYEMFFRMAGGSLIHFLHHIGTTSSSAHETSALNSELSAMSTEAGKNDTEAPDMIVRSHRHRASRIGLPGKKRGVTREMMTVVTPCWQLKTPYAWKIAGARIQTPQIGGCLIREGDEELHMRWFVELIGRSKEQS